MRHRRFTYPGHIRFTRNTLAVIAVALLGYRIIRAAHVSTTDAITSAITGITLIGATALGYLAHVRHLRAQADKAGALAAAKAQQAATADRGKRLAEQEVVRLREVARQQSEQTSEEHAREEEERSWWAAPKQVDHDTIAFGTTVVPLDLRRRLNERDLY